MSSSPVVEYFDGVADVYDEVLPFFVGFARQAVAAISLPPDAQVLDLAAGRGALSRELAGRAGRVVAVDAAPRMVERLARDLPAVETHVMDAAALGFADATFDLVTVGFAVHIMADPVAAVAEVKRVLRPGGQFAFTIPGRADCAPDPWDDPLNDLFNSYRKYRIAGPTSRATTRTRNSCWRRPGSPTSAGRRSRSRSRCPTAIPTGASSTATARARS